jgi:hypothetical protein
MGDRIDITKNSGSIGNVGSQTNTYNGVQPAASPGQPSAARNGRPELALYGFADIVGYSQLSVRLQKLGQDDLVRFLDRGLTEAGVDPGQVSAQDQGDARLLTFPAGTDVAKVLAAMPRSLNDELAARNRDMASHARMRVRLAFSMGASTQGAAGLVGGAPIAVARIANSDVFRRAMQNAPRAHCGLLIDDYLHGEWIRQEFRADINADDYASVRVWYPDKGFDATAWLKLFGYSGKQVSSLLG